LCAALPGACSLDPERSGKPDDAAALLARLRAAAGLIVAAPVYFYGLPASGKALVDRSQRYWPQARLHAGMGALIKTRPHPPKPAYAILSAGRTRGARLFDGSLLTLRPFFHLLGFHLRDHLPLRGLDAADALAARPDLCARVREWISRVADHGLRNA
jgi:multimeric flavodoxin WrbA